MNKYFSKKKSVPVAVLISLIIAPLLTLSVLTILFLYKYISKKII